MSVGTLDEVRTGRLVRTTGVVMAAFLLSRTLGLVREIVIGLQFGTSRELDAYLAAFRVPDFIFQLIAGGALASAFIPTFTSYLARGDERGAWRLASAVFTLLFLILTALSLLAVVFTDPLVRLVVAPGFEPAAQALTVDLMRLMLISTVIFGVSGVAMSILNSYQHFLLPALAPSVYNLAIVGGALLLSARMGIYSLAWGVVVGALGHLLIQIPLLQRKGATYRLSLGRDHPGVREVARLMLPRTVGLMAVQVNFLVNTILASGLAAGSLAALNYAWLLMLLPQGLIAQAVATVAFPTLAELAAREETAKLRQMLSLSLRMIWYLTLPAAVGLFLLREPLIRLLLERGRFDAHSTQQVAWALGFFTLGLLAHATVEITSRGFYALHDTRTPVVVALGAMAVNIVLSILLLQPLAHGGLALANSIATLLEMLVLLLLLRGRSVGMEGRVLAASSGRMALAAAAMGLSLIVFLAQASQAAVAVQVLGALALGIAVYLGISLILGSPELLALRTAFQRGRMLA